ncbi:MAG: DNA translocase FtsK 4TM domain-containing protein [Syntrophaceae bacterium]|nr:DNA translocase FtsK 4TM domain-containing protein [Syntrophaceae bacterium]
MNENRPSSKRIAEIAGLSCLAVALFLFLALGSYHPLDPSFTHYDPDVKAQNITGSIGSYTADTLVKLFGGGILWLPVVLVVAGLRFFQQTGGYQITASDGAGLSGVILATSSLISLLLGDVEFRGATLHAGGWMGTVVSGFLNDRLYLTGSLILLSLLLTVALLVLFDFSLAVLAGKAAKLATTGGERLHRRGEEEEARGPSPPPRSAPPRIEEAKRELPKEKLLKAEQTHFEFNDPRNSLFQLPPLTLLESPERREGRIKREDLLANSQTLEKKLSDFGVEARVIEVKPGPVITMYELEPAPGVKINRITNLSDDLALALRAPSIRIIAPIPGKGAIGIEIPNQEREPVRLRDVLDHTAFRESHGRIPIALGKDIVGTPMITDLISMPHLLIAGTTGSGKSVSLNAMICSILFKAPPDEVKFLMIDPKRLELSAYEGIPHLLHPVVVDPKQASLVLRWAVEEMERRYRIISEVGVKSIEAYNRLRSSRSAPPESSPSPDAASEEAAEPGGNGIEKAAGTLLLKAGELPDRLPYLVIIIDELADLMMVAQRNVEESLTRLAQMARASGIHMILATQRPSVDVITGIIKANFPTRISFQVSSKVDSRTILDQMGAEKLLGQGDMLFIPPGISRLVRIHGAYVSDQEIERIASFVKQQGEPVYDQSITAYEPDSPEENHEDSFDEKYDQAVELVTDLGQASISLVQRYLKIGYNRAARIIERMETEGIVGPADGAKPRKVLARKLPR